MSQNLGLHRNCDNWELTSTEKEERKRAFYCCFVLDRLSCAMHGRSPMIDERDYDAPYPSENDIDAPHIMENFHYLIKVCEILGDVIREIYMIKGRKQLSMMSSPDNIVSSLDKKLNKWMSKLPANLQYRPPNTRLNERAPAPSLQLCQLHMLFYTTLILLHRPFIPGPQETVSPSVSPSASPSASICTFAANKILDITESLLTEGRLKHVNNYSLFFMFTAGIIFIYNAASSDSMFAFEAKISINKIMRAMDVVETTWITSARHCNILGALAGLRDIDLDCVDQSYTRATKRAAAPPPSIAVPNSPEPDQHHHHDFQRMEEKYYVGSASTSSNRSPGVDFNSPETANSSINKYPQMPFDGNTFDPDGTAFWGVPMSLNIDEWNSYFSNQKGAPDAIFPPYESRQPNIQVPLWAD